MNCYFLDLSPVLATTACNYFIETFSFHPEVCPSFMIADFMNLPQYADFFEDPMKEKTLRVVTLFGGTLGNLSSELKLVRHSLRALKKGDLLLLTAYLGFAPPDKQDIIREKEPLFHHLSTRGNPAIETWIGGPLERYRKNLKSLRFEYVLKQNSGSMFPNSYTMEAQAIVDEEAQFTVLELHRYELTSFLATFNREGFKPITGKTYGYKDKRLMYLFAKE